MRSKLLEQAILDKGYCCRRAYVLSVSGLTIKVAAPRLGVSDNTLVRWRAEIRDGLLKPCPHCPTTLPGTLLQLPDRGDDASEK